jgi:hypothetical protein
LACTAGMPENITLRKISSWKRIMISERSGEGDRRKQEKRERINGENES